MNPLLVRQTVVWAALVMLFGLMSAWITFISSLKPLGDVQTPDPIWLPVALRPENYAEI